MGVRCDKATVPLSLLGPLSRGGPLSLRAWPGVGDRELAEDTGLARSAYMSSESALLTELLLEEADETDDTLLTDRDLWNHTDNLWYHDICIWFVQIREPVKMDSFFCLSLCIAYLDLWDPEWDREGEAEEERDLECELEPDKLLTLTLPITVCLPEKQAGREKQKQWNVGLYAVDETSVTN